MNTLRLALIRQRYTPFGGAERFIERAIVALERKGASITMVTRNWKGAADRETLIVDPPYAGRLWRDASFSRAVRRLFTERRFDLVQSHERIAGCDLYRAGDGVHRQWLDHRLKGAQLPERIGIRLNPYHWYVCAAERTMFNHPALRAVICNSNMVAGEIRAHFGVAPEKLQVIYNGVDLAHFDPGKRTALRNVARDALGFGKREIVFGFVGSGFARKGLGLAIDALAASGRDDLRILVAGRDRAAAKFAARAARAGVGDRVQFVGPQDDVRSIYAASDCLILPTRYDPFPNAALEALAMGLPAIVSAQCGAAEIIESGLNGWICELDDPIPLGRLLAQAADADRETMGAAARRTAERFGVDAMAGRMIELYERLLAPIGGAETKVDNSAAGNSPMHHA